MTNPERRNSGKENAQQVAEILGYLKEKRIINLSDLRNAPKEATNLTMHVKPVDKNELRLIKIEVSAVNFLKALHMFDNQNKSFATRIADTVKFNLQNPRGN